MAEKWFSKNLGDAMWALDALDEVKQAFQTAYQSAADLSELALFSRHESDGRLQCEVVLYFSPAAYELALKLGAAPCPRPATDDLSLLAGAESAWELLK